MTRISRFSGVLRRIVADDRLVKLKKGASGYEVELQEPDAPMRFKITGLPSLATIVQIGLLQHLKKGIKYDKRRISICDYLLVVDDDQKSWVVLIEMKKSSANLGKAKEQLRRSLPLLKYLQSMCEVESQTDMPMDLDYLVLVEKGSDRFDKQRTRVVAGGERETPQVYNGITVQIIVGSSASVETFRSS